MNKEEFTEELRCRGFNATYEDGTVVVIADSKTTFRKVERIAKEVGYDSSFCWRGNHGKKEAEEPVHVQI